MKNILSTFSFRFEPVVFPLNYRSWLFRAIQKFSTVISLFSPLSAKCTINCINRMRTDVLTAPQQIISHSVSATKLQVLDVYSSALQPAFSHLRNIARPHFFLHHPLPDTVAHTFVQPLCLVLFRLLKCSPCWLPYQRNQMTAAGTEPIAKPSCWHRTRRPI